MGELKKLQAPSIRGQTPSARRGSGQSDGRFPWREALQPDHQSTTDPEARLYKKGKGKEGKLCFGAHVLMENRHGLCVDFRVESATEVTETQSGAVDAG